jgi:hypothetical protein
MSLYLVCEEGHCCRLDFDDHSGSCSIHCHTEPLLTADPDPVEWRLERLQKVLQFVRGLPGGPIYNIQFEPLACVDELHDHEGMLTVRWAECCNPTEEQKTWFHVAWSVAGGEPYGNVEHIVPAE